MDLWLIAYYVGGGLAIFLCWNLGAVFYVPMIMNLGLEVLLGTGVVRDLDIRHVVAVTGFLQALWVVVLSDVFRNWIEGATVFVLISLAFLVGIYPSVMEPTQNWAQSILLATLIIRTWMYVIVGVVLVVITRSVLQPSSLGGLADMIVNPKKRFLLPLGFWAMIIVVPLEGIPVVGDWMGENRFHLAGTALVWGWVLLEIKFFVQSLRIR
ncbi:MAG: hypothetical protein H6508_00050 [Calditrichaeota bacterium]|nr:hypothetical protein [Calditrichota bacterium]MCB9365563.1 hypothetical protein [Calditrichota bacterium]